MILFTLAGEGDVGAIADVEGEVGVDANGGVNGDGGGGELGTNQLRRMAFFRAAGR